MSSWFHSVSGLYFPDSQTIGLDYGNLLLDPEEAQLTLSHETVHSTITQTTDYGQASSIIYAVVDNMNHLTHMDKKEIKALLIEQQLDVQEAFATLIEGLMIKNKHGKLAMLAWAESLPTKYAQWLGGVQFVTDWSKKQRELFTSEISYVSFETGARREIPKLNLLVNKQKFLEYLNQADNNPNMRFNKLCELLRYKNWLITKSYPDLCKLAGIKYHKPTTKAEVANFVNYVTSFTNNPTSLKASDVGDTPKGIEAIQKASSKIIIGNLNFNLEKEGKLVHKPDDFLKQKEDIELLFISPSERNKEHVYFFELLLNKRLDVNLAAFSRSGEKLLIPLNDNEAVNIINNELKTKTLICKWGAYNYKNSAIHWLPDCRIPEYILYNHPEDLLPLLEYAKSKTLSADYIHIGSSEKNPLSTVMIKIERDPPIHVINVYGAKNAEVIIKPLRGLGSPVELDKLVDNGNHFNNLLSVWMNLRWDVDWYETMKDKESLVMRDPRLNPTSF